MQPLSVVSTASLIDHLRKRGRVGAPLLLCIEEGKGVVP